MNLHAEMKTVWIHNIRAGQPLNSRLINGGIHKNTVYIGKKTKNFIFSVKYNEFPFSNIFYCVGF